MDFQKRLEKVNQDILKNVQENRAVDESGEPAPTDLYQDAYNARYEMSKKKFPKGSGQKVAVDAKAVLETLAPAYRKAKDDSDTLFSSGDKQRSEMVKQQYMEEKFLPAIDSLVMFNSAEEILNNKKVLDAIDNYVLINGGGGSGYAASYIRNAYGDEMGEFSGTSDAIICDGISSIKMLIERDKIASAIGLAKKLKSRVDNGDNIASEDDYELIQKVALR